MLIKLLAWTTSKAASDGSLISAPVWEEYIRSERCQTAIDDGSMLCTLTHRSRNLKALPEGQGELKGTVGKDDGMLICTDNNPAPIMKIVKVYLEGDKVYAIAEVFDEKLFDPAMANQIIRFKGLLRSGVKIGCSCVLVCYWQSDGNGHDIGQKIHALKGIDITVNPSCPDSRVISILEDESPIETEFSDRDYRIMTSDGILCKTFSDPSEIQGISELPRSSKIGMRVCALKVKQFSNISEASMVSDDTQHEPTEKVFSIGSVKERLRINKMSPRVSFRRLIIDYRGALKASGGADKMKPEDVAMLKSMFVNDLLLIIKQIHSDILAGKQISTLLGASSVSKSVREACQKLQLPYRMAMMQQQKSGYISKDRMKKIQDSYVAFTGSLVDEVFGGAELNLKEPEEGEEGKNEEGKD